MGNPDVITISLNWFIGIGVSFRDFNGILDLSISIPFINISIYFKKHTDTKWFKFYK